ncbi:MerR family transcriptional regulator [Ectobacillus polymachus]|uniref:MerR family transcriptional regulator n=1 Tax=Ectobacillus polymachus TaxID=1508806 RepID=UPI003A849EFB
MDYYEGKYNIKAVSNMLGIHPGTLRAWERRYQIIAPKRNEAGHRLYTEEHVKILKWLLEKVNEGFTIGQAVSLLESSQLNTKVYDNEASHKEILIDSILHSLLQFDEIKAHEYLNEAFSIFSVDKVTTEILLEVVTKLRELCENHKITSAHEHFAMSFLRSRIGMIYHNLTVNTVLPKVITVCGPNETHELGLLIFTIYLRRKGYQSIYLGTSIEENDIDIVIEELHPKFVFLSCSLQRNVVATIKLANRLREKYDFLTIGLGGGAILKLPEQEKEAVKNYIVGATKEEWDRWIIRA